MPILTSSVPGGGRLLPMTVDGICSGMDRRLAARAKSGLTEPVVVGAGTSGGGHRVRRRSSPARPMSTSNVPDISPVHIGRLRVSSHSTRMQNAELRILHEVPRLVLSIGAPGFEPGTSCSRSRRANRAALRPADPGGNHHGRGMPRPYALAVCPSCRLSVFQCARRDSNPQPSDP